MLILRRIILAWVIIVGFLPLTGTANDSTAILGAGGLELGKTTDIQMVSEDLRIAPHQIKIDYVFKNTSDKPITTTVAFPLPAIPAVAMGQPMQFPVKDVNGILPDNYVEFQTLVNNQSVAMQVENKAILDDQDVTQILKDYGLKIIPAMYTNMNIERYQAMSKAELDHLQNLGLIYYDPQILKSLRKEELETAVLENWSVQTVFYWEQLFPAKQTVKIHHEYIPLYGTSVPFPVKSLVNSDMDYKNQFCMDAATINGLKKTFGKHDVSPAMVDYILTTGANWQGPIQNFKLTLDKEDAGNILSTCFNGLKKISPTQFQVTKINFIPQKDLHILVVSKKDWYRAEE